MAERIGLLIVREIHVEGEIGAVNNIRRVVDQSRREPLENERVKAHLRRLINVMFLFRGYLISHERVYHLVEERFTFVRDSFV